MFNGSKVNRARFNGPRGGLTPYRPPAPDPGYSTGQRIGPDPGQSTGQKG